jgi:hypothetical protein
MTKIKRAGTMQQAAKVKKNKKSLYTDHLQI